MLEHTTSHAASLRTIASRTTALLALLGLSAALADADVVPTNNMLITEDTRFVPGTYNLPNGVRIGASNITLDMNTATLVGTGFNNYGVRCLGSSNVIIKNGACRNYYYGMRVENAAGVQILNCDLSGNWVDPNSLGSNPPFLNINVDPNLTDRTNLGGGLFLRSVTGATIADCLMRNQENGIDMYSSQTCTVTGNDASNNTGWGIHLYQSTDNVITGNACDYCTRTNLNDSAGMLLVFGSSRNQILNNSFQFSGDGFFIGNEGGCPSNDNLVQGNDGSYAGANAFEATFSSGNQFTDNDANGCNYGFWLGYSHSGNVIRGNRIRANNANGIEIEHGQNNTIQANEIIGNGGRGIVLRTDGQVHFPPNQFPCLNLPDQAHSSHYAIRDNIIHSNFGLAMELTDTTDSLIVNNLFGGQFSGTVVSNGASNAWSITPTSGQNIVGGPTLGGNWWSDYAGQDNDADGLGDTAVPYTNAGQIAAPGDPHPLIGDPDIGGFDNPHTLPGRMWIDLGRNTRSTGGGFDTANGAHFATDGTELYLLEGVNSNRLSRFNPISHKYEPRAAAPQTVWDGGDFQYGDGKFYAGMGIDFNVADGSGRGSFLYAYNPAANTWLQVSRAFISNKYYCHEALAYDPIGHRLYGVIVNVQTGGDADAVHKLALYDPVLNRWTGFTSAAANTWYGGSEAEYLGGRVYVWRGGSAGGAVNGSDSYLDVYDIATDTWSTTPTLQSSNVIPGFRSGAFDGWGVSLTADAARGKMFVMGAETNRLLYVFDVATQAWSVGPTAPYDSGWGASIEFVAGADRLYQIDGRDAWGQPQGTAVLVWTPGDANCDGSINQFDITPFMLEINNPSGYAQQFPDCDRDTGDTNGDGSVNQFDIQGFVDLLTH